MADGISSFVKVKRVRTVDEHNCMVMESDRFVPIRENPIKKVVTKITEEEKQTAAKACAQAQHAAEEAEKA